MVEPIAAVILNSLLSGRSTVRSTPSLNSVARVMASSTRLCVSSDFFTPQPRRVKGKERADSILYPPCHLSQCQEWSSCTQSHSLWCPHQSRFMMMEELDSYQEGALHHYTNHQRCQPFHLPSLTYLSARNNGVRGGQRRHASYAMELKTSPGFPSTSKPAPDISVTAVHTLREMIQLPDLTFPLDAAWEAYNSALECSALSALSTDELLELSGKFAHAAQNLYRRNVDLGMVHEWGHRIRSILALLEARVAPASFLDYRRQCLLSRAMAITGDLQQAIVLAHAANKIPLVYEDKAATLEAYETIILSTSWHHSKVHVLEFVILEWMFIGSYLTRLSSSSHYSAPAVLGNLLRRTVFSIVSEIENPAILLASWKGQDSARRSQTGNFLIEVLCERRLPSDALDVLREMERQRINPPLSLQLTLVRSLAQQEEFESANSLYSSIPTSSVFKYYLSTGLYLFAHQGDDVQAKKYYNLLTMHNWATEHDIAMFIYSYAKQGRVSPALDLFNKFFPEGVDGKRQNSPALLHYSVLIFGFAQKGDFEGINMCLGWLSKAGLAPDVFVYTIILNSFARRGDMDNIAAVLEQMRAAGVQPNAVSYTTIITLLAKRKDSVSAELVYKRALEDGIVPDRRMVTAMMNAHVEAGSWQGVIRAFDYIKSSPTRQIRFTIEVYNTLLKAYVLIGTPFKIVSKLFTKLGQSGVKPNAYTYSLLVQSACDSGKMNTAADIFYDMARLEEEQEKSAPLINAYVLTILMAGFLRAGDKVRAKGVYDEMQEREIKPTSVSFGTILKAYGKTEDSMKIVEEFVQSLSAAEIEGYDRTSALNHIYGPVLHTYAAQGKVEDVERLFQNMLDQGGSPSLGALTALLDVYRRTFNIKAVLRVWPQIYELGLQFSRAGLPFEDKNDTTRSIRRDILCIPLSIYIDALSAAGHHLEIANTWKEFKLQGLTFDSHNWNHLAVALVRAGEPERAFEVLERVILPHYRQVKVVQEARDLRPDTPLLPPSLDDVAESPPLHRTERRAKAVRITRKKLSRVPIEEVGHEGDFAHPLHILHQISPAWTRWKPHAATLSVFLMALLCLRAGALIPPIASNMDTIVEENHSTAKEILDSLDRDCPESIQAVLDHEFAERQKLGKSFDRIYNWRKYVENIYNNYQKQAD